MVELSIWRQGDEPEFNHNHVLCLEYNVSRRDLPFYYCTFSQLFSPRLFLRTYYISETGGDTGKGPVNNTNSAPARVVLTMSHGQVVKRRLPKATSRTPMTRASPFPLEQRFSSSDLLTCGVDDSLLVPCRLRGGIPRLHARDARNMLPPLSDN